MYGTEYHVEFTPHLPKVFHHRVVPAVAVFVLGVFLQRIKIEPWVPADEKLQLLRSEEPEGLATDNLVETSVTGGGGAAR